MQFRAVVVLLVAVGCGGRRADADAGPGPEMALPETAAFLDSFAIE